jgi:TRAP-type C4-dicarboxylate transport system substrate-binding protein
MKTAYGFSAILLVIVLVMPAWGEDEILPVKLATALSIDHPTCQAMTFLQRELGDRLRIQIFPDAQLGSPAEILEELRFGNIELGVIPLDMLASLAPQLSVLAMPYIFRDDGHRFRVLDGPLGIKLLDLLAKQNLIGLGFFDTGMYNLITKRRYVMKPEQLQGLKIGVIANCPDKDCQNVIARLIVASLTAQGAVAEPVSPEDVIAALQAERFDGWQGHEADCLVFKFFETGTPYFTYTKSTGIPDVLVASKMWFDALAPGTQKVVQKAANVTIRQQRQLWADLVQNTITQLEAKGMKFETAPRDPFVKIIQPVYAKMYEELGAESEGFVQAIMAVK